MNDELPEPSGEDAARSAIDGLTRNFYAAFDNREGREPDRTALYSLFADDATICRIEEGRVQILTTREFVEPRFELLRSGQLREFHEREVEAETVVLGDVADRRSRYRKCGATDAGDFSGSGRKHFRLVRKGGDWLISSLLWEDDGAS